MKPFFSNVLLLGSAGRNSGKTTLAEKIIYSTKNQYPIIAIKITTVMPGETSCPRGGEGCGVCKKLVSAFELEEERISGTQKDTQRLLRAGAQKVFWLKASKESLKNGFLTFMQEIGTNSLLVCESNSLREHIKPGVFLMLQMHDALMYKSSAKRVREFADRIVLSDGESFDFDIEELAIINDGWRLREKNR